MAAMSDVDEIAEALAIAGLPIEDRTERQREIMRRLLELYSPAYAVTLFRRKWASPEH
jgi:hypothetical protein